MKIGVITSGFEMLPLFKVLSKIDAEYSLYWDWNSGSYGDKDFEISLKNVEKGVQFLIGKGVEKIIVPPVYELELTQKYEQIFPVFERYVLEKCLSKSLIGKIGIVGDYADIKIIEKQFKEMSSKYLLNDNQKNIKKFHFPFAIWKKNVNMWKFFVMNLGARDWMINRTIREDLRYFKDAGIDTLIPLNYSYFAFERAIKHNLNPNKIRFAGVEEFQDILKDFSQKNSKYGIKVYYNGTTDFLISKKKWIWLLTKGNPNDVVFESVS